jgi:hypothetical protein
MLRRVVTVWLGLALSAAMLETLAAAEPLPPASQWIPQETILTLEISRPKALLDTALDPKVCAAVTSLPVYQQATAQPGFKQFLGVIGYLERTLGTDWKTGLRKLLGGGVTFAAGPDGGVLLMVDAEDGHLLSQLHDVLLGVARNQAQQQGQPQRVVSVDYRGVAGWTFGGGEAHAILGNRLLVANKPEVLKAALDLREDPAGRSLASLPAYLAAKKAAGSEAAATAFVNLEPLKQIPGVVKALSEEQNPLAALLLAGIREALRESNWLAMGLEVDGQTLKLEAAVDGTVSDPSGPAAFALPRQPGDGALPNLPVPRRIAGLSFYRDLHGFYAAKDELFPERSSGLIFFENMMGIFFTGRDLTEEVFAETKPEVRVVVAEQEYDPSIGTPQVQLPAFALILRLRHPQQFAEVMEEAWQKALGLINFTSGQKAQPGLIIDRLFHGDTKFSVAYYSASWIKDKANVDTRYNFRPALAVVDDDLILSSTEGLARDVMDALAKETADAVKPLAGVHSLVELDLVQLASILGANREALVRGNMVGEGNTKEQAETTIGVLLTILEHLGQATLSVGSREGQPRAALQLKLSLPEE